MTGQDLKVWRTRHRYSARALAEELEISSMTISNYENGHTPIRRQFRLALAAIEQRIDPVGENGK